MGIILDLVVIGIILLNIYICYEKGLVKLAVGLVAVFASILLTIILYRPISQIIIENTEIDNNIENAIIENFTAETSEIEEQNEKDDSGVMKYIEKYVDDSVNKTKNEIVIEAAETIAIKVINIGVMIIIFVVARLVLIVLTFITDIITELPILKQFNAVGGVLYGLIKALLIIYAILAIAFFIVYVTGNTTISTAIESSFITKMFYNNNLLLSLIF